MSGTERGKIEGRSVLYLAPGFMSYRVHKHVRGVQVFDLQLIRQMVELGLVVTLPAERSWKPRLIGAGRGGDGVGALGDLTKPRAGGEGLLKILWTPTLRKPLWNGLWAAGAMGLSRARFDVCYLGNAGEGLAQAAGLMHRLGIFQRLVLLAHRYPKRRLIGLLRRTRGRSLAVSNNVRSMFPDDLDPPCEIRFGEMDHAKFFPASRESAAIANDSGVRGDGLVHFVMLGALDTPLKDVPTALKAFGLIPDEVRAQCRLHLASFAKPPTAAELPAGVTAYPWMPIERVPEFLRSMDAMLVTSLSETFCLALVQGMLTGMPSVVRDIGTLTEKVDGGAGGANGVDGRGGLIFSTPEQLAEHMTTLAKDARLRATMGEAARRTALERYTWRTEEFVREVLFGGKENRE
ncbi:MAG: glycosyltransferase family 4 protein [Phycisphaerales bacterium]|nr:glycosyltransferase family 4 protein [Phycisphaerales bacterium]